MSKKEKKAERRFRKNIAEVERKLRGPAATAFSNPASSAASAEPAVDTDQPTASAAAPSSSSGQAAASSGKSMAEEFNEALREMRERSGNAPSWTRGFGWEREDTFMAERSLLQHQGLRKAQFKRGIKNAMWLDPNGGQSLKLGKYSFGLTQQIKIGAPAGLIMSNSPCTTIRTKRICMNAPFVGFATISCILIANVAVTVGGDEDAYAYSATSYCGKRDLPTCPPSQKATVCGQYTGLTAAPLRNGKPFTFCATFIGRSTIAGGA